jgi:hypothetical protein
MISNSKTERQTFRIVAGNHAVAVVNITAHSLMRRHHFGWPTILHEHFLLLDISYLLSIPLMPCIHPFVKTFLKERTGFLHYAAQTGCVTPELRGRLF